MNNEMGMTNKQFQAFIRLLELVKNLLKYVPEEERVKAEEEYNKTIQLIKEDN